LGEYIKVGKLLKPFGVEGYIKVDVSDAYFEDLLTASHVFFREGDAYIPLFIEGFDEKSALLIKFDEVDSKEDGLKYNGLELYLDTSQVSMEEEELPAEKLLGFRVINQDEEIGTILEILDINEQLLGVIEYNAKEVILPLADDLIVSIDTSERKIVMQLPDGLLEL
jgi:16S rRNA processing protein RimM